MNRKSPVHGYGNDLVIVNATLLGGGDGESCTIPADTVSRKITNAAESGTRTGEGVYDVVLAADSFPVEVIQIIPTVSGGSTARRAEVTTAFVNSTRTVVITTRLVSSDAADDLDTDNTLKLLIIGRDSAA